MKKLLLIGVSCITLAACAPAPQPICDREAQEWNKFDTVEDTCDVVTPAIFTTIRPDTDGSNPRVPNPDTDTPQPDGPDPDDRPDPDPRPDPRPDPSGKVKGNNGLGNGDQQAPGKSGSRNRAENDQRIGKGKHRSGKGVNAN